MQHHVDYRISSRAEKMAASELRELMRLIDRPDIISFAGGLPDPSLFDVEAFSREYALALEGPGGGRALQYAGTEGYGPLREWLCEHMAAQGVRCRRENILVTSGSQQALDLIAKLFIDKGDVIRTSRPTYLGALQSFSAYEPRFESIHHPMEPTRPAKFFYVVPDFANPTGETLTTADRLEILRRAQAHGGVVVEDAAYTSLRYRGEELPSIAALDQAASGSIEGTRTLYCGTFSKTLSPGIRVGWICGPSELIRRLTILKQGSDLHTSTINQMVALGVAETMLETQVRKVRSVYRSRLSAMDSALERYRPEGLSWVKPDGGMFIWLSISDRLDPGHLLGSALAAGVAFVPGTGFFPDGGAGNFMRLSFSLNPEALIYEGIRRLCSLLGDLPERSDSSPAS
jgi:DNA-binding transcriptional MocR family regulator